MQRSFHLGGRPGLLMTCHTETLQDKIIGTIWNKAQDRTREIITRPGAPVKNYTQYSLYSLRLSSKGHCKESWITQAHREKEK